MLLVKTFLISPSKISHASDQYLANTSLLEFTMFTFPPTPLILLLYEGRGALIHVCIYSMYPSTRHLVGSQ